MKAFLLALQFLTVAMPQKGLTADAADLAASRNWYGLVGALLGCLLAAVAMALGAILPPLVLAALLLVLWAALTRFLHLDGVADTADALIFFSGREKALAIMKDTRLGAFGAAAIALVLILKFAALASLAGPQLWAALVAAPALGRALAAGLSALLPPASQSGLGASVGSRAGLGPLIWSGLSALAAAVLTGGLCGLAAGLGVLLAGAALGAWYHSRLGGVTGDNLGAAIELGEATSLIIFAAWPYGL